MNYKKIIPILLLSLPVIAFADEDDEDVKDYTGCQKNTNESYRSEKQQCWQYETGYRLDACLASAERHLQENRKDCKEIESEDTKLNMHPGIDFGFGNSKPAPQPQQWHPPQAPYDMKSGGIMFH